MEVAVLIATHRQAELLLRTLESIMVAKLPPELKAVVVVENGEKDGASEVVCDEFRDALPIRYLWCEDAGKSRALNWAIRDCVTSDFFILFDDDVRVAAEVLQVYVSAAKSGDSRCYYGGPFGVDYEKIGPPGWLIPYLPTSAVGSGNVADLGSGSAVFWGCNYAFFRSAFLDVGGFDEAIGPGAVRQGTESNPVGQETDFMQRLLKAGYRSQFVTDAKVWHFVPQNRCTPQWTLHRRYRQALTAGMTNPDFQLGRKLCGVPLWIWWNIFLCAMVFPASYLPVGARRRFFLRKGFYEYLGRIRGLLQKQSAVERQPVGSDTRASCEQGTNASSD